MNKKDYGHWRLNSVMQKIKEGNIEALADATTAVSDGGTHCCHEFESEKRAMSELVRLAKIGQKTERAD